jgi:hypothetical protein
MLGPDGSLCVSDWAYERIVSDLDLIRDFEPSLVDEPHSPAWFPDQLRVWVYRGLSRQRYECYNSYFGLVEERLVSEYPDYQEYLLTFSGNFNIPRAAFAYETAPEVHAAEPYFVIGGENFWSPTPSTRTWHWQVDNGFLNCFDGCDCHRLYEFETDIGGQVTLLKYNEVGEPWCEFPPRGD